MNVWVLVWSTESGDSGVWPGFWREEPSNIDDFVRKHFPDDWAAKTIYYTLESLREIG